MTSRGERLQALLGEQDLGALIVSNPANIAYLTGFTGSNGTVAITAESVTLITDARYTAWAERELGAAAPSTELVIAGGLGRAELLEIVADAESVGLEAAHVSWAKAESFRDDLGERMVSTTGLVEGLREVKSAKEVDAIREAAAVTDQALAALTGEIRPGQTEVAMARRLAELMFEAAGIEPSFDIIVATGQNSAKPHHEPTDRVVDAGDLLIIDSGAIVEGYRSDMTRSFIIGSPTSQQQEMLDAVLVAQQAGVDAVEPGVATAEIDAACRTSLRDAGFGEYFTHGTGHGVGLEIHEAPSVSSASTATLTPGHVITVEPGVYIPDVGGVRWEDTVVVTSSGSETLTHSPKQPRIVL